MRRIFLVQIAAMFCLLGSLLHSARVSGSQTWRPEDMKPGELTQENDRTVPIDVLCGSSPCKLVYFVGDGFDPTKINRKNILYIGGGPGNIVDRKNRDLQFLETNYNVVYFDIRAAGLSFVPIDNSYDRFLRARFVVEDIEKLRREALKDDRPWDVIYAHSWGTVVAQQYAKVYGPYNKVLNLVLSAPVSRVQENIKNDRDAMIRRNLEKIYAHYKNSPCAIEGRFSNLLSVVLQPINFLTNDFCSLSLQSLGDIQKNLTTLMGDLDKQSLSLNFVSENYEEVAKADKNFLPRFPYGKAFFGALRSLQYLGGPDEGQVFDEAIKERQVSAAIVIGYYMSPEFDPGQDCKESRFIKDLAGDSVAMFWKKLYCTRFEQAKTSFESSPTKFRSNRAYAVYGLYDGLNMDAFRKVGIPGEQTVCIKGSDIEAYESGSADADQAFRQQLRRIGSDPQEQVCRWNPAKYRHKVPTLILKGGADPVIAGNQAEYVFEKGLEGEKRVLIEIPGLGHFMTLPPVVKIDGSNFTGPALLGTLLDEFLNLSLTDFVGNERVKKVLSGLRAKLSLPRVQGDKSEEFVKK